jgi:hypothetical protein
MEEETQKKKRKSTPRENTREEDEENPSNKKLKTVLQTNSTIKIISIKRKNFYISETENSLEIVVSIENGNLNNASIILEDTQNGKQILKERTTKENIKLNIPTKDLLNMDYTKTLKMKFEGVEANFGEFEDVLVFHKLKLKDSTYYNQIQGISIEYLVLLYLASDQNDQKLRVATEFIKTSNFKTQEKDANEFKLSNWNSFFISGDPSIVQNFTNFIRQYLHEYRFGFEFTVLHHLCCHKKTIEVIDFLINDKIVNVNEIDKFGNTPLFYSERYRHSDISKLLKKKGANENILNFEKKSIKDYVKEKAFEE